MKRRVFLAAVPLIPFAGVAVAKTAPQSEMQQLFRQWKELTANYKASEKKWSDGVIDHARYDDLADPVLELRDEVERKIFNTDCQNINDLRALTTIASYFDWTIEDYNEGVMRETAILAELEAA